MKKLIGCLAFLICLTGASIVHAHPASEIDITFDPNTRILLAVITHNVSSPERHYIDLVDIMLNGNKIIGQFLSKQDNNIGQTVSYLLPEVVEGDVVAIDTHCNKGGNLKKELKVTLKN